MNFKRIIYIQIILVLMSVVLGGSSCKKHRLKKDKEVLVGTWVWVYTARRNNPGTNSWPHFNDTVTPITEGNTYKMQFCKNGKIKYFRNDSLIDKKRIVFSSWNAKRDNEFDIHLDNDPEDGMNGRFYINEKSNDTLEIWSWGGYPFGDPEDGCHQFAFSCTKHNFFIRE